MKITKAIIPVAGLGTRFLPITKAIPKEMFPIGRKPILQYIVEEAVAAGIKEIFFIVSRTKKDIEDYFDYDLRLEHYLKKKKKIESLKEIKELHKLAKFVFIHQHHPAGNGDAILLAKNFIKNEPSAILFGDDIIDSKVPCLSQLIKVYEKYKKPVIAINKISRDQTKHFGCVKVKRITKKIYQVNDIIEKPPAYKAPSNLGVVGRYIITPQFLNVLEKLRPNKNKERGITDAIRVMIKKDTVYACQFEGEWYTSGNEEGLLKANIAFAFKNKVLKKTIKKFLYGK